MLSRLLSILLGLVYIVSGIGKLLDVSAFLLTVVPYNLPDYLLVAVTIAVPPFEILLGCALILFAGSRPLALVSAIFILVFTGGFVYAHFAEGADKCGCFGVISALETTPLLSVIRNIALFAASVFIFRSKPQSAGRPVGRWRPGVLALVCAASFALSAISLDHPIYTPEPFLNRKVEDTAIGKYVHTSPDSTYFIFAMSLTCPHCWNSTENVKAYKTTKKVDEILAIGVGSDSAATVYAERFHPNFGIRLIQPKEMTELTGGYIPKAFIVRGDSVVRIIKQEIPSPWSLEEEE